jgi:hypothetical protein
MLARAVFVGIALFWVTMNALLWRAEFGNRPGNVVPVELVWEKILTSPDSSSLVILHHGNKIGLCQWLTGIGESWAEVSDENLPSGAPAQIRGYRLHVEGTAMVESLSNRLRFEATLKLGQNREWQELYARVGLRPVTWEIQSASADRTIRLKADADGARFERVLKFSELQNPFVLVRELAGPVAGELFEGVALPGVPLNSLAGAGLQWEAREDELPVGHTQVKVYRLQARLLDRYQVTLFVSRVGELLRVELPNDLVLANDLLATR